jgi:hypothetical protein
MMKTVAHWHFNFNREKKEKKKKKKNNWPLGHRRLQLEEGCVAASKQARKGWHRIDADTCMEWHIGAAHCTADRNRAVPIGYPDADAARGDVNERRRSISASLLYHSLPPSLSSWPQLLTSPYVGKSARGRTNNWAPQ